MSDSSFFRPRLAIAFVRPLPLARMLSFLWSDHPIVVKRKLQVNGRGLRGFLLLARDALEAGGEGVGDAEVHGLVVTSFAS